MGPNNIIIVLSKFGAIIPHGVLVGPQRSHSSLICRFLAVLVTLRHDILRQVFGIYVENKKKIKNPSPVTGSYVICLQTISYAGTR